jgi:hypothetical protein
MSMSSPGHAAMKHASPPDRRALAWWRALCILAVANVCLWLIAWHTSPGANAYSNGHLALSAVYVLVCAYRSVLPRVDLERLVLVDSFLSSIILGRVAATVAEICFAVQLGLWVHQLGARAGLPGVQLAAWGIPVFMTLAQAFCWHSVLTLNHFTQAVESLLWAAGFSMTATLLAVVAANSSGWVQAAAVTGLVGSLGFVTYVLAIDAPMYLRRYRVCRAQGQRYLNLASGARDAMYRRVPSRQWAAWKEDALWLTPYFSLGTWVSIAMVWVTR